MSDNGSHRGGSASHWLRSRDQSIVALAALAAMIWLAGMWLARGGAQGHLAELDVQPPRRLTFQVDVNAAGWAELALLPRVGPTLARRIVASREEAGPFASIEDLRRVRGIGPKTLESIRPYLQPVAKDRSPAAGTRTPPGVRPTTVIRRRT